MKQNAIFSAKHFVTKAWAYTAPADKSYEPKRDLFRPKIQPPIRKLT